MPHPAATIVIPVWNQWELTRACLESLRPTLGTRDRVVVVDNGSQDQTPAGLRAYKWVEVITNETNRGFAVASNQGAARAEGEIVVFLNNDTVLTRHWLDALLAPFADPEVGATGPRSNFVSGPQLVPEVGYAGGRMGELRDWAKGWSRAHRGETTDVARLVGFCLAVRKAALDQVGLFDERFDVGGHEDDDLCNRLTEAGWRLVIAHEAFVHHHGHKSFEGGGLDWYAIQQSNASKLKAKRRAAAAEQGALISACMIVKDEERDLPACLASLEDLADEIVVYDTGSSDRTRDIAREAGATVIEGHWDDDFGRARNAALAECTGRWILHIDADEVAHADPVTVRAQLHRRSTPDALMVPIDNLLRAGSTASYTHTAARLFRRDRGHWEGRLHERVVARPGEPPLSAGPAEGIRLGHTGYLDETIGQRDKIARNLRLAEAALAAGDEDPASANLNLGRALVTARRLDDALPAFEAAVAAQPGPATLRATVRAAAEALLAEGRADEALGWIERFRAASSPGTNAADLMEAQARIILGDPTAALGLLDRIGGEVRADDGYTPAAGSLAMVRSRALLETGRAGEAADVLLDLVRELGPVQEVIGRVDAALAAAGRGLAELAGAIPDSGTTTALAEVTKLDPERADELLEVMWAAQPTDPRVLATVIRVAARLPVQRALEWSARVRAAGMDAHCPLVAMATDFNRPPDLRVRAGALAAAAFGDERGGDAVELAAAAVPARFLGGLLGELVSLAPDTLDGFIVGAATDARRALALAKAMHDLGGPAEALAVLTHGLERPGTDPQAVEDAAAWLEATGRTEQARALRAGTAATEAISS
jgi:GT2 family glycosyltransferase/tetratricopeptide (TPR) repeat protein